MIRLLLIILISIILYSCGNSDPCDAICDNCINMKQCQECYEECYSLQ